MILSILDKDGKHRSYQKKAVLLWLDNMLFADRALNRFLAPFRGKVTRPAYYFGTDGFVVSGV